MAVIKMIPRKGNDRPAYLRRSLKYICQPEKTEYHNQLLVHSWNCSDNPEEAYNIMRMTQSIYGQENSKKLYVHFTQSFPQNPEITPELVHQIGIDLIDELQSIFKGFEIVMGTHTDTETLHNHFVLNRTNTDTGMRWNQRKPELKMIKNKSIELCYRNGIDLNWVHNKGKALHSTHNKGEYLNRQHGSSWKIEMEKTIAIALEQSCNKWEFMVTMQRYGYNTMWWDEQDYVSFISPYQFKCRSTTLYNQWNKAYFESVFEKNTAELGVQNTNEKSKYGMLKALSKDQRDMRGIVDYAIHHATSRNEFIQLLNRSGYDVSWKDGRKNITISKNGKTSRLATLMKPDEWTKESLLQQFVKNCEFFNSFGENAQTEKTININDEYNGLFDFSDNFNRLSASFNRVMRFSRSPDEMTENLMQLGYNVSCNNAAYTISDEKVSIPITQIQRFSPYDYWNEEKMNETFYRNSIYRHLNTKYDSYERNYFRSTAQAVMHVQNQLDDYAGGTGYEKLEGQALKELAISLSSSEFMHWEDKGFPR